MCSLLFQFIARHKIPAIFLKHFSPLLLAVLILRYLTVLLLTV